MNEACRRTGLTFPTVAKGMTALVELGIARELTGHRRNRLFSYQRYLAILSEGTEPLPRDGDWESGRSNTHAATEATSHERST